MPGVLCDKSQNIFIYWLHSNAENVYYGPHYRSNLEGLSVAKQKKAWMWDEEQDDVVAILEVDAKGNRSIPAVPKTYGFHVSSTEDPMPSRTSRERGRETWEV